jgi:hypothetical protein
MQSNRSPDALPTTRQDEREPRHAEDRVVCYSIAPPTERRHLIQLQSQLLASVSTLRRHNQSLAIHVYWLGPIEDEFLLRLKEHEVEILRKGTYEGLLHDYPASDLLAKYPILHKYLTPANEANRGWRQLMLVDCDTLFLRDPIGIFEKNVGADVVGRAEPGSKRGSILYDSRYLNEDELASLAKRLGSQFVPPINCGVLLFSDAALRKLVSIGPEVVRMTLRLMAGVATSGEVLQRTELMELRDRLKEDRGLSARISPLPYPSSNQWIVEEIAFWLVIGSYPSLKVADFSESDVAVGGEVVKRPRSDSSWTIGHYFSNNMPKVKTWWSARPGNSDHLTPDDQVTSASAIDAKIRDSKFIQQHSGFAVYRNLFPMGDFRAMADEALEQYWEGQEERVDFAHGSDGRGGHPARRLVWSSGGEIHNAIYQSKDLHRFLTDLCGVSINPTGRLGSFNYYTRDGDFMGLHLDVDQCDLVVLTALRDESKPNDPRGAIRVYPRHLGRSLRSVRRERGAGAVTLKLLAGQSLVMFGGLVPHEILPVHAGQQRIVSALCFRAGTSNEPAPI